jgi:hypothetical protein
MARTFSYTQFKAKRKCIYMGDTLVIDLSNSYFTPSEVIDFLVWHADPKKSEAALRKGKLDDYFDKCHDQGKIFPRILTKWMKDYGYEPNLKGWRKFDEDYTFDRLPCNPVSADISKMSDPQLRAFVRKHGLSNIEHYHRLRMDLMRIDDPDDSYYSSQAPTPAARQHEKLVSWRYAALRITGMDHEDAMDKMVRNYWIG